MSRDHKARGAESALPEILEAAEAAIAVMKRRGFFIDMSRINAVSRIKFTPRERIEMRGFCTGPIDGAPAPGEVGLDLRAACCTCKRRVYISLRGRYAHHKPKPVTP